MKQLIINTLYKFIVILEYMAGKARAKIFCVKNYNIGIIAEEFFHADLRGFGGFGKTVKNVAEFYNDDNEKDIKVKTLLSEGMPVSKKAGILNYHNTEVLFRPASSKYNFPQTLRYNRLARNLDLKLLVSIDYYPSYEYVLSALPYVPFLNWIHDPRDDMEWRRIATDPLVVQSYNAVTIDEVTEFAYQKRKSIRSVLNLSTKLKRKIIFATQADCLVQMARNTYGLDKINPYMLHNPITLPNISKILYSDRPSLCFLGRLDTIKRPQVVFHLAQRFQNIDFYMAGTTHEQKLIQPFIEKFKHLPNLHFLGHIDGQKKHELLAQCWGIINTSIHEALPVSFLEALAYGKCIISCQNPDHLTDKFGYYTGEVLGSGTDDLSLDRFSVVIEDFLKNDGLRLEKGLAGQQYVQKYHSYENFDRELRSILKIEKLQ